MSIWRPHLTVAAIVEQEGRFLLVEEACEGQVVFNQPAGHLDENETLLEAVVRETLEEAGRHFTPEAITGFYQWKSPVNGFTYVRIAFCGDCSERDLDRALDTDIIDTVWLTPKELAEQQAKLRSPMVLHCIEDYMAGKRYPLDMFTELSQ
jgi:8-oxo-dGTP pyrophosphatase MutT (NUDIX family)